MSAAAGRPASARFVVTATARASTRAGTTAAALHRGLTPTALTPDEAAALFAALTALGSASMAVLDALCAHLPEHANAAKAARALGLARDSCRWMANDQLQAAEALGLAQP